MRADLATPETAPRILLCIPTLLTGGAERQVRQLAPLLVQRGIALSLFGRLAPADVAVLGAAGVTCFPIRARGNHNPLLMLELARAARASRTQVIHSWLTQMDILGGLVALTTGRRWLLSERSGPVSYTGRPKDRLRAQLGRFADAIVANSPSGLAAWPGHPRRLLIANGVDHDGIRAAPRLPDDGPAPAGRTIIVTVARLVAQKRTDRLLRALASLRETRPDVLLMLVGEGPEKERLQALARDLNLTGHVLFAGLRPDAWSWLRSAQLFVSASQDEGHPNAVLEAASAGIPMALSDIPAHRDAAGEGALYVDADDPAALAGALLSLVEDRALAQSLVATARDRVAPLTMDRAAALYADLYRKAAAGEPLAPEATAG